jgi:N-formylglutamate deformylase
MHRISLKDFHAPYHAALREEIDRIKALHGIAVLYDCHSIRSNIPYLFQGRLPDFNIGTNSGNSCHALFEKSIEETASEASDFTYVLNGRFKGGWTTRHYGKPREGVHAIQMELAQASHLVTEATPFAYDQGKAEKLRVYLKLMLERIERLALDIAQQEKKS